MQKYSSGWLDTFQGSHLSPSASSTPHKPTHQQPAFKYRQPEEPARVLLVESNTLSQIMCQDAFDQETITYTIAPDYAAAHIQVTEGTISDTPFDLIIGEFYASDHEALLVLTHQFHHSDWPAMILIGPHSSDDILMALRLGVADYLPYPVQPAHMRASVKRVMLQRRQALYRSQILHRITADIEQLYRLIQKRNELSAFENDLFPRMLTVGPLWINTERQTIQWQGHPCAVTPIEYSFLHYLAQTPEQVRSYSQIVRWTHGQSISEQEAKCLLKSHARNLRRKFGLGLLEHLKGRGYVLHVLPYEATGTLR